MKPYILRRVRKAMILADFKYKFFEALEFRRFYEKEIAGLPEEERPPCAGCDLSVFTFCAESGYECSEYVKYLYEGAAEREQQ